FPTVLELYTMVVRQAAADGTWRPAQSVPNNPGRTCGLPAAKRAEATGSTASRGGDPGLPPGARERQPCLHTCHAAGKALLGWKYQGLRDNRPAGLPGGRSP